MDTAGKRFSAIHVTQPWRGINVLPSGTVGQAARQAAALMYSGIAADVPTEEVSTGSEFIIRARRRRRN